MRSIAVGRRQVSQRQWELLAMPSIDSQFPVTFENGAVWEAITGHCSGCNKDIDPTLLRGRVTSPIGNVAVVEAVGVCHECKLVTEYLYRLHDDMRITGFNKKGQWVSWHPMSFMDKMRQFLRKAISWLIG